MALINDFLSLIYPRHCEACSGNLYKHELFICTYCTLNLPQSHYHQQSDNPLHKTFAGRIPIINAGCYYLYEKSGKIQKLLHAIKYQNQKELAEFLGKLYASEFSVFETFKEVDTLIPIPLHKNRLKARGYNQSEWFARGLSLGLSKLLDTKSLQRLVDTSTQTKKRKFERWENVDGIFNIKDLAPLKNKHILLIDDVITTGATLEAAWQELKKVEGIKISIASIAFASKR